MRVTQISQDLHDGGAARCVRELLNGLPHQGIDTRALVADASVPPHPVAVPYRHSWERYLSILELFPGSTDWRHRGSIHALSRINHHATDVVHLHVLQNGAASIRAVASLCRRVPAVWTLHDEWAFTGGLTSDLRGLVDPKEIVRHASGVRRLLEYSPYHDSFRFRDTQRLLKRWMPQPRIVVTPSYAYAARARSSGRFPNSEIRVIRNGVSLSGSPDCSLPREEARSRLSLPNRPTVLLLAATLKLPVKGISYGIAALNRMNPVPHVLLVGDSSHELRDSIRGEATCLPRQNDATLVWAYRAADVTLVPSLAESFSLVAAESMACGTPVVGFSVGGLAELIGSNERGFTAKPYDIEELSSHVMQLLDNRDLCVTLGESGRRWIHAECSMESHLRSIVALYRDALHHDDRKSR